MLVGYLFQAVFKAQQDGGNFLSSFLTEKKTVIAYKKDAHL